MFYWDVRKPILITLILLSVACTGEEKNIKKDNIMTLSTDPVVGFLSSYKEKIIGLNDSEIGDIAFELFEYVEKKDGIPMSIGSWVVAPKQMNKDNRNLLSAYFLNGLRAWEVNFKRNTFLLLRHWESGKVWINTPYLSVKRGHTLPGSAMGNKPSDIVSAGWNNSISKVDILDGFSTSLPDGKYTITQIYYDKKSNSENFSFSSNDSDQENNSLTFLKITAASINDASIEIKFQNTDSLNVTWDVNVIAFKLDNDPIIVPFHINLEKDKNNSILALPTDSDKWEKGIYQIYIDGGKEVAGPFELNL